MLIRSTGNYILQASLYRKTPHENSIHLPSHKNLVGSQHCQIKKHSSFFIFLHQKSTEPIEDESVPYAEPVKPVKRAVQATEDTSTDDTTQKPDKPVSEEPEPEVAAATGFFNPLYQTRAQVQQFEDISSIFASPSPPPEKELDDVPEESDC